MSISKKKEIKIDIGEINPFMKEDYLFSEETISSLSELGSIFEKIHKRLIKEGYIIKNGKILKPNTV